MSVGMWDTTWTEGDTVLHATPADDLLGHELNLSCACQPHVAMIDGTTDFLYAHNAWDGRAT